MWDSFYFSTPEADTIGTVSRPTFAVRYIEEGSIVVPGMSGKYKASSPIRSLLSKRFFLDSHAHILEYGASRLMDLEGAKTIQGT